MVSDKFMSQVEKDELIELKNPQDDSTWNKISAKDIFDLICFSAWNSGDPGILFYDRINKDNIFYPKIKIKTTNPCFSGDTLIKVLEDDKIVEKPIESLVGKMVTVYDGTSWVNTNTFRITGEDTTLLELELRKKTRQASSRLFYTHFALPWHISFYYFVKRSKIIFYTSPRIRRSV